MQADSSVFWRQLRPLTLLVLLLQAPLALAEERPDGENPREESWQILQRQLWFEQTRDLRSDQNVAGLRAEAVNLAKARRAAKDAQLRSTGEVWREVGPSSMQMTDWIMGKVSGRMNAITPDPTNEDTAYIGAAAGGVWKTTNGGTSWAPLFNDVGTQPIGSVTLDPANPAVIWVGTGDKNGGGCAGYFGQGVFLSEDAGTTWTARNGSGGSSMPLSIVNAIAVQPNDSNVILAAGAGNCNSAGTLTGPAVYRSTDRGLTWAQVRNTSAEDIIFVPGTNTVYAAMIGAGVFKSTDGGATWAMSGSGGPTSGTRMRLAMAPSDSNVLYVLVGSSLYRTGDGGETWTRTTTTACEGQCTYNQTIDVHPTDPNTILVGTIRTTRSTDGGVTFNPLTEMWGTSQAVHQDTHVVLYSRTNPNRFWIGGDGGIWRSDNAGVSFKNMNANLNLTMFYDVAVHPEDVNVIYGGAQDNSSLARRTSLLWELTFASGDGFMNAIDQIDPMVVFQTSYPQDNLPNIVRSTLGGSNGSYSGMPTTGLTASTNFPFLTPMASAGRLLFVTSNILYRADTTGSSWTAISPALGSTASVISPELRGTMTPTWVGTSGGRVYSSPDAGIPTPVFANVTGNYPGGRVSDIAIDPFDTQRVFIARSGFGASRLYRTTVGGTTWTAVGTGLPNVPANSVIVDPLDSNRVFVGTDVGVYESIDGGNTFTAFSAGMPLGTVVMDLEISSSPHVLTAATYGRGAWQLTLAGGNSMFKPTADFAMSLNDLVATFTDHSIDTDGTIASRNWTFGDGTAPSSDIDPIYSYATPGNYNVVLTVTDNDGLTGSYAKVLRIPFPPIPLANGVIQTGATLAQGDSARFTLAVPSGATNLVFTTTGTAGEDADLTVRFGDTLICQSAGANANESCGRTTPAPGTYTATVDAYTSLSTYTITGRYNASDIIFASGFD